MGHLGRVSPDVIKRIEALTEKSAMKKQMEEMKNTRSEVLEKIQKNREILNTTISPKETQTPNTNPVSKETGEKTEIGNIFGSEASNSDSCETIKEKPEQPFEEEDESESEITSILKDLMHVKDFQTRDDLRTKIIKQQEEAVPELVSSLAKIVSGKEKIPLSEADLKLMKEIIWFIDYFSRHINATNATKMIPENKKPDTKWFSNTLKGAKIDVLTNGIDILFKTMTFCNNKKTKENTMELTAIQKTILQEIIPAIGEGAVDLLIHLYSKTKDGSQKTFIENYLGTLEEVVRSKWHKNKDDTDKIRIVDKLSQFRKRR